MAHQVKNVDMNIITNQGAMLNLTLNVDAITAACPCPSPIVLARPARP